MSRSEQWTEPKTIMKNFKVLDENIKTAGPVVLGKYGRVYYYDGESHFAVLGRTGMGKTSCVSITFVKSCIVAKESFVVVDPKGSIRDKTIEQAKKTHQVIVVDFSDPRNSPNQWNPMESPYKNYISGDLRKQDIAGEQIHDKGRSIYAENVHADPFWPNSALDYYTGLVYGLFDKGKKEEINMDSIAAMMADSEKKSGGTTVIKEFSSYLPEDSVANRNLATYTSAPGETRSSIHSVAANGLSAFARNRGLMSMLSRDNIDINSLDVDVKPLAIYCIIPDETSVYNSIAGLFISQLIQHFERLAREKYSGRLPNRLNLILEELATIGKSITNLPELMAITRERNIRIMLVLQDGKSQLKSVYGEAKAETIISCVGVTFAFSTNSWETLNEWSQRCGERLAERGGNFVTERLITPTQLAAMPVGRALILIDNQYKYITQLPFHSELFDTINWEQEKPVVKNTEYKVKTFNMEKFVEVEKEKRVNAIFAASKKTEKVKPPEKVKPAAFDIDEMVARIDKKIAELEAEEKATMAQAKDKKTKEQQKVTVAIEPPKFTDTKDSEGYTVVIWDAGSNGTKVAKIVSEVLRISETAALSKLEDCPVDLPFRFKKDAKDILQRVTKEGGMAILTTGILG